MDLACSCQGAFLTPDPCEYPADGEDGLCSRCRETGCPQARAEIRSVLEERLDSERAAGRGDSALARTLTRWLTPA